MKPRTAHRRSPRADRRREQPVTDDDGHWLDAIEAQIDDTVPYYVPRLIHEIRQLRAMVEPPRRAEAITLLVELLDPLDRQALTRAKVTRLVDALLGAIE